MALNRQTSRQGGMLQCATPCPPRPGRGSLKSVLTSFTVRADSSGAHSHSWSQGQGGCHAAAPVMIVPVCLLPRPRLGGVDRSLPPFRRSPCMEPRRASCFAIAALCVPQDAAAGAAEGTAAQTLSLLWRRHAAVPPIQDYT